MPGHTSLGRTMRSSSLASRCSLCPALFNTLTMALPTFCSSLQGSCIAAPRAAAMQTSQCMHHLICAATPVEHSMAALKHLLLLSLYGPHSALFDSHLMICVPRRVPVACSCGCCAMRLIIPDCGLRRTCARWQPGTQQEPLCRLSSPRGTPVPP